MSQPVLEVRDLTTRFKTRRGIGTAVNRVSFDLHEGETLGLVGESGSGKSMTALSIVRLNPTPASEIVHGEVRLRGTDLLKLPERRMRQYRGGHIGMILQDPQTALNPMFTIGDQLAEPLRVHLGLSGAALRKRAVELLTLLRVPDPEHRLSQYPHQLSGGTRQRIVGAIALSCKPEVIIADEPTTSLDVTVQETYLELLKDIQREMGVAILFITHDLGVVARMCDRVAVMYAGRIVEEGVTSDVLHNPSHPYTEALLRSVPLVGLAPQRLESISGQPPSIFDPTEGCPFAPRCAYVHARCWSTYPPLTETARAHRAYSWWQVDQ